MYDDALRYRRVLLDANPKKTFYIDVRRQEPYVTLVEKKKEDGRVKREAVEVRWLDERYRDPVAKR
jgi:hypothetical protein